jgi:pyruvate formate lyase activating enzyme
MSLPARLTEPTGKEAELYRNLPSGRIQCTACARFCQIGEGQVGLCGVRGVVNGKLYLLVYGKVIAAHIDPIEKKPLVHYRPGSKIFSIATTGCNWLCHPAGAEILMSNGKTKNVEEIVPGDSLWSYEVENGMEIHPSIVTHTGTRIADVLEVRYGNHSHGKLCLTAEHPVFTPKGWKEASSLSVGDKILRVWNQITESKIEKQRIAIQSAVFQCRKCNESFDGIANWNRHRGACYTEGLEHSPERLAVYSKRMKTKNPMKDPKIAARAIASSRQRFLIDPSHGWHRNVKRMQEWLHAHPSKSQVLLYALLEEIGIQYEKEHRIRVDSIIPSSNAYYIADAAFPSVKLDIEVDGWWHFNNAEVMESDKTRDETLKAMGWEVLRIPGSYVYNHPDEVKQLILERLTKPVMVNMRYWVEVKSIRKLSESAPVYGLETIPNHNYVADGILVHNCQYCQNADISQRRRVEGIDVGPDEVVAKAKAYGCEGLAYTYNQPTIFMEYARDVGRLARTKGLFNLFVSNGFDTPDTVSMMKEFLDGITVDFKGSGETNFLRRYIGIPGADPIFQTLLEIKQRTSVHLEITDLVVPKVGADTGAAEKLCRWIYDNLGEDTPIHFLRFHPDYKMMDFLSTPVATLEKHYEIGKKAGLRYVYIGNVPGHPAESTYCPGCGRVLIRRYSYEILEYNLDGRNACRFCGQKTPIVGPLSKSFREDRFVSVIS